MQAGNLIGSGQKSVTSHGTAVKLLEDTIKTSAITIKANSDNSGNIYVGDSSVDSATGFILDAGEEVTLVVNEGSVDVYIDSDSDNDGVNFIYWAMTGNYQ